MWLFILKCLIKIADFCEFVLLLELLSFVHLEINIDISKYSKMRQL